MVLRFELNGRVVEVGDVDPHTTLLHWLRARGLTGSKEGCAEGECGACAVALVVNGTDGRPRLQAVNSCLVLVAALDGQRLVTVEGIAEGEVLHPVQHEIAEGAGSQCGYCTPGFVVSMFAEYHRARTGPLDEESFAGNLCRCTGYRPLRDAARKLAVVREDRADAGRHPALAAPVPPLRSTEHTGPAGGPRLVRPTSLAEALELLRADPALVPIAGGTDLVVEINQRQRRMPGLLSLEAVAELRGIREADGAIEIGAGVPLAEIEERLHGRIPLFDQLLPLFSSRLVRARATLGGNLATASPIGDSPPVLLALGAEVRVAGASGERAVPIDEFFTGYRATALRAGELVRSVRIPTPLPSLQRFYKVSKRRMDDISTVAAAFALDRDASGTVTRARLAYGGVAATPVRARRAEEALTGRPLDAASVGRAKAAVAADVSPMDDHRGSARYRRAMVASLLDKLLADETPLCARP